MHHLKEKRRNIDKSELLNHINLYWHKRQRKKVSMLTIHVPNCFSISIHVTISLGPLFCEHSKYVYSKTINSWVLNRTSLSRQNKRNIEMFCSVFCCQGWVNIYSVVDYCFRNEKFVSTNVEKFCSTNIFFWQRLL